MYFDEVIVCAVFIHTIFIFSIFDIYFKSPIVNSVSPVENPSAALTKRVVLISADGLRLDALFDRDPITGRDIAPYVRSVIQDRGSWGMSESHLPTESRPGHVAMLAGFYEDPSAVTKGWKQNPVDFDSLFNRSRCVFAWGSPEIVPMFARGTNNKCIFTDTYEEDQRFAGNTMDFDNWVYLKMKSYMESFSSDASSGLHQDKIFFFLHLLGQDTSGHTHKPHTKLYRQNLNNVDQLTRKFENFISQYYKDNQTTFIFTSDHGMTDWGSHGSGDITETQTPFIAWGAGINKPDKKILGDNKQGSPYKRMLNISQADITPMIATLLGISIPVNSIGIVPVNYFDANTEFIANAVLLNAQQMAAQFKRKLEMTREQNFKLLYRAFNELSVKDISDRISVIKEQIATKQFSKATDLSRELIKLSLKGLEYFHNYYQRPLFISITISYIAWIVILLLKLSYDIHYIPQQKPSVIDFMFLFLGLVTVIIITFQQLPVLFYCYFLLPQYLLWVLTLNGKKIRHYCTLLKVRRDIKLFVILYITGVEILVFSFFERLVLTIPCVINCSLLLLIGYKANLAMIILWVISSCSLCVFTLMPVVGKDSQQVMQVIISGVLWIIVSSIILYIISRGIKIKDTLLSVINILMICAVVFNVYHIYDFFKNHQELSTIYQIFSWVLWMFSSVIPFLGSKLMLSRLLNIFVSLSVPFLLLSVSHEGFFMVVLFLNLFVWLYFEFRSTQSKHFFGGTLFDFSFKTGSHEQHSRHLVSHNDFFHAYIFLSYIFIAFFGTGNIASLNSFDPVWVRSFLTTFSPFTMTALILFKTIIPFLAVLCTLKGVAIINQLDTHKIFMIVLVFSNVMGLNFLYLVTNRGSWLDIGTSISHYVIQQTTALFLVILYGIAKLLTSVSSNLIQESFLEEIKIPYEPFSKLKKSHSP